MAPAKQRTTSLRLPSFLRGVRARSCVALLALCVAWGTASAAGVEPGYRTLKDDLQYRVQHDGASVETHVLRIRVDSSDGIASVRTQRLVFNKGYEKVRVLDAYVIRTNGRHTRAMQVRTLDRPVPGLEGVRDVRTLEVDFDTLQPGDTLYLATQRSTQAKDFYRNHFFIVVEPPPGYRDTATTVTVDMPQSMPGLQADIRGFIAESPVVANGRIRYRWRGDGSVNEREEFAAADRSHYNKGIWLSTLPGFPAMARELAPHYRKLAVSNQPIMRLARAITDGLLEPRARVLAIQRWVQQHIGYRAVYPGLSAWLPTHSAVSILRSRAGDCKDHAVLIQALLDAVGIESTPVMTHMGFELYHLPALASPYLFDHVMNYVPSLDLYVDATDKEYTGGFLPPDRLDKVTMMIRDGSIGHTPAHQDGRIEHRLVIDVQADGSAHFDYGVRATGMEAGPARYWFASRKRVPAGEFGKALLREHGWSGEGREDRGDVDGIAADYAYAYHGQINAFLPASSTDMPARSALLPGIALVTNGYKAEEFRTQPFMCEPHDIQETATYRLPAELEVEPLPPDTHAETPILQFSATYRLDGRSLRIERHLRLVKGISMVCTPEEFEAMRPVLAAARRELDRKLAIRRRS